MTDATFRTQRTPEATIVAVHGEIDLSNAHELSDAVHNAINAATSADTDAAPPLHEAWIDLTHTTYLDSAGINALAALNRDLSAQTHPTLGIIAPADSIARRVLDLVHFDRLMPLTDTAPPTTKPI